MVAKADYSQKIVKPIFWNNICLTSILQKSYFNFQTIRSRRHLSKPPFAAVATKAQSATTCSLSMLAAGGKQEPDSPVMLVQVCVQLIECQILGCFVSNGPKSISTSTRYLPLKSFGARHEDRQTPPHPYSNEPAPSIVPDSSKTVNVGGDILPPFLAAPG